MFKLIKNTFIGVLIFCTTGNFLESLDPNSEGSIKCISLNNRLSPANHLFSVLVKLLEVVILLMIHILEHVFQIT